MATSSMQVDGLISGLDVTSLIAQLMQAEAAPQNALRTRLTTQQSKVSAYQSINTKMASLRTAAEAMSKTDGWKAAKATSSSTNVTATAAATASPAQLTFTVDRLAQNTVVMSNEGTSLDTLVTSSYPPSFLVNGVQVQPTTGKLSDVINAINNTTSLGVRAFAVRIADGTYALQLAGTTPSTTTIDVTGLDGFTGFQQLQSAQTAQLRIGAPPASGTDNRVVVESSTNTFTDLMPGVSVTATKADPVNPVTLTVDTDSGAIADRMQAMVDAANAAITEIGKYSDYSTATNKGGVLLSDFATRQLSSKLAESTAQTVSVTPTGGTTPENRSMGSVGVSIDRYGKLTFDRSKFLSAYASDPAATQTVVSTGVAKTLTDVAKGATDFTTGSLTLAIQGSNATIKDLNTRIANWDDRLALRKSTLQRQFTAMETALGKLKDQSNWLAGQIASLG